MFNKTTISCVLALSACAGLFLVTGCGKPDSMMKDDGKMESEGMMKGEGTMEGDNMMKGEGMMEGESMMKDQ